MKCHKCGNDIKIQLDSKIFCKGCKVLTNMTTTVTMQCDKCGFVSQIPIQSKSFLSVKKDKEGRD